MPFQIGNSSYVNLIRNLINNQGNDSGSSRVDRLEKRRERLDQTFDELRQQAIDKGDAETAQKIFEVSQLVENKLDQRLDRLESKTGQYNLSRHLDNVLDELQANAYATGDTEMANKIFGLSRVITGSGSDASKQLLLQQILSGSPDTNTQSTTGTADGTTTGTTGGTTTGST